MTDFSKIISEDRILLGAATKDITDKETLFENLTNTFLKTAIIQSSKEFLEALEYRESQGPTYMGNFIAIPHGQSDKVAKSSLAICRLDKPIEYESHGEQGLVKFIFMFAIEKSKAGTDYLRMLADLSRLLMNEKILSGIESATNERAIIDLFSKEAV